MQSLFEGFLSGNSDFVAVHLWSVHEGNHVYGYKSARVSVLNAILKLSTF